MSYPRLRPDSRWLSIAAALTLVLAACGFLGERGSGDVITETREVSGFTGVELKGSGRVELSVTGTESLTIEADDNIMPLVSSEVVNGTLVLRTTADVFPSRDIVYTITAEIFDSFELSGSGSLDATGVDSDSFEIGISGSGSATVVGSVTESDISISGSGSFHGENFVASEGTVAISGSGSAIVNVTDQLDVTVSGSGSVEYLGDPSVSTSVSGSGDISKR